MNPWIAFVIGLFVGANIGLVIAALLVAASRKPLMTEENGEKSIRRLDKDGFWVDDEVKDIT